ncbi:hypothetical protein KKC94_05070 [Patescibacteria group bacterium]|nr:hypothetical protein [Patescibacteria group bacterium]
MTKQIHIYLNQDLYDQAKQKCQKDFGIGLSPLIKVFLKSFVTQSGVGFYVGDQNLRELFNKWIYKKRFEKDQIGYRSPCPGPRLHDLYDL